MIPKSKRIRRLYKALFFILLDVVLLNLSWIAAYMVSFGDYSFSHAVCYFGFGPVSIVFITGFTAVSVLIHMATGLYFGLWAFAGIWEVARTVIACLTDTALFVALGWGINRDKPDLVKVSTFILFFFILASLIVASRLFYHIVRDLRETREVKNMKKVRVLLIGAGAAADMVIREMKERKNIRHYIPVGIIDDDPMKTGGVLHNVRIVGTRSSILSAVEKYKADEIWLTMPSADKKEKAEILERCKTTGCALKIIPDLKSIIDGDARIGNLRKVEIEDLLGRDTIRFDMDGVSDYIRGKTVIVTGGGGSIGSELCRQIASFEPKRLIIFDIYENNAYDISNELKKKYPDLDLVTLIGSVRDSKRIGCVFDKYRPQLVFHAAAHKHVPLMEDSPNEAIKNNVFGTYKTAKAASEYGAEKFVLISTDKAVNPTNVMGASKRLCEMVIQYFDSVSETDYAAVRFGNVLGSNGSVIPLFKKQIASGGPVTVTDKRIIRYFMTIPEAVSLVLEAGTYAKGGEIFVLDMGQPVKILDLAENLIRLSGYTPYKDIDIVFTGLRPGEKLYEELLVDTQTLTRTANDLIFIDYPQPFDYDEFVAKLLHIYDIMPDDSADIRSLIRELVPTYITPEQSRLEYEKRNCVFVHPGSKPADIGDEVECC